MRKKILTILLLIMTLMMALPSYANQATYRTKQFDSGRKHPLKPKKAFWKKNRINLFYPKKQYEGLDRNKYKNFSVGVMQIQDERMSKFYHKRDNFFQTPLLPSLQIFLEQELNSSKMFKEAKMIYEPFDGYLTSKQMEKIRKKYNVDMLLLVNLTDFQLERRMGKFQLDMVKKDDYSLNPLHMPGMENKITIGGIFQLVFLPNQYVIWSDNLKLSKLKYAKTGRLKSKEEMEPMIHDMLFFIMTDMLCLISEDGKRIKVKN